MDKKRDKWSKADIAAKIVATILIPIIIVYLTNWYAERQRIGADYQRNADRITTLLKYLASENPKERILAAKVCESLAIEKQLPQELVIALIDISDRDELEIQKIAHDTLNTLKSENSLSSLIKGMMDESAKTEYLMDIPDAFIDNVVKHYKRNGADVITKQQRNGRWIIKATYRTSADSAVESILKNWNINGEINKEFEDKLKEWMNKNGIDASVTSFIFSQKYKELRIKALGDLGIGKLN